MRVMITNKALTIPEGSETAVYTLALELKGRGHDVVVYTPRMGLVAGKLLNKGVPVIDDITFRPPGYSPEIIHVHHRECLRAVASEFPDVPKLWVCNGMVGEENPSKHEHMISGYAAVSEEAADHIADTCEVDRSDISVIHNGVNVARFAPVNEIGETPERIAVLSNRFKGGSFGDIPVIGKQSGGAVWNVEKEIIKYDVIATAGRGAMESLAAGRAVIVMGPHGIDGMLRGRTWRHYIKRNFSGRTKRIKPTRDNLLAELEHYDRTLGTWGRQLAVEHFNIRIQADRYLELYRELIESKK